MLKINEIFGPTIQGEGKSTGKEVVFLRLANCNLHCVWCDTPYTWRFDDKFPHNDNVVHDPKKEVHEMSCDQVFEQVHNLAYHNRSTNNPVKAVVISGGEPLLQQKRLGPLLAKFKQYGYWVEVETNGTVRPNEEFLEAVDQINCSPKLSNSGDPKKLREKGQALLPLSKSGKTNFKFVISTQQDVDEANALVKKYEMKDVYLMSEGRTVPELSAGEPFVLKAAEANGLQYTQRLHIIKWGPKRGV